MFSWHLAGNNPTRTQSAAVWHTVFIEVSRGVGAQWETFFDKTCMQMAHSRQRPIVVFLAAARHAIIRIILEIQLVVVVVVVVAADIIILVVLVVVAVAVAIVVEIVVVRAGVVEIVL
jgi:hypothetical protein